MRTGAGSTNACASRSAPRRSPSLIELQAFVCPVRAELAPPVLVCQQHTLADYDTLLSEMAHG